ncbi:MAG TPA: hypothetical protein VG052_00200 [Puia sp.]|nr:hypothetical protein [Puia sp.]
MKSLFLSILFSISFLAGKANIIADGYFITRDNDTVKCRIRVDDLDLYTSVTIFDTADQKTTYKAERREILGFGFTYDGQPVDYLLKVDDYHFWLFRMRMVKGNPYNLYYFKNYKTLDRDNRSTPAGSFMIEDTASHVITWNGVFNDRWRARMYGFLHNDQHLIDLYNKTGNHLHDLPVFVQAVNELGR